MPSFKKQYQTLFKTFGCPLIENMGMPAKLLAAAEKRLRVRIPRALRDYCLVAGRERRFNTCHHRLLAPADWMVDRQHLIFMEENQRVVLWGVSIRNPDTKDPPVSQGVVAEPIHWARECRRCSDFLRRMLLYQAVSGGMPFSGIGDAPEKSDYRFDKHGWISHGELGGAHMYSRQNQVVCLQPVQLPYMPTMKINVSAGARTEADFVNIGKELSVTLQSLQPTKRNSR